MRSPDLCGHVLAGYEVSNTGCTEMQTEARAYRTADKEKRWGQVRRSSSVLIRLLPVGLDAQWMVKGARGHLGGKRGFTVAHCVPGEWIVRNTNHPARRVSCAPYVKRATAQPSGAAQYQPTHLITFPSLETLSSRSPSATQSTCYGCVNGRLFYVLEKTERASRRGRRDKERR